MRWTITVLTLCFTFSTSSFGQPAEFDDPHGKLRGFDGTFREDGRLPAIVLLAPPDLPELSFDRPETREARRDQITRLVAEVLRTHPAVEVRHRYENFAGFHSAITEDQLVALLDDPRVQSIEPTHEVTAQTRQGIPPSEPPAFAKLSPAARGSRSRFATPESTSPTRRSVAEGFRT